MTEAVIIDVGVGNLGNLRRALRALGAEAEITTDPERVRSGRSLLLPGVGAFRPPRETLRGAMEDSLRAALADGAWLFGICVGYQLLFDSSHEFGDTDGLGLLEGGIRRLPDGVSLPHIGWNALHDLSDHPILEGVDEGGYVYFVHSFAPDGTPAGQSLASCTHGRSFAAISARGRVVGSQFHPEKSGDLGLRLLANFLEMSGGSSPVH
jgi:glutamine amidotransferase